MAVRLKCDVDNYYRDNFLIEIIDTSYNGAAISFETDLRGADFNFNGESKSKGKTINTTEFRFLMRVSNEDHLNFWEDLGEQQEGRFFVRVYSTTNEEGDSGLRFIGHLVVDESYLQDKAGSQFIELRAADGLYRLSDQEYKSDSDDQTNAYGNNIAYYEGYDTALNIIFKCLAGLGTQNYYSSSDEFLWINHNWYESEMGSIPIESVFEYIRLNQRLFTDKNEDEEYFTMSRSEVLDEVFKAMNCQISYKWGSYFIDNANEKSLSGRTYKKYSKDGTFLSSSTVSALYTVDNLVKERVALTGGKYSYLPPLKRGSVNLSFKLGNYGYVSNKWYWESSVDNNTEILTVGDVEVTSDITALAFNFNQVLSFIWSGVNVPDSIANTKCNIFMGITIKFGNYYWITEWTEETREDTDADGNTITISDWQREDKWSLTPGVFTAQFNEEIKFGVLATNDPKIRWSSETYVTSPLLGIGDGLVYNLNDVDTLSVALEFWKIADRDDYERDYFPSDVPNSEWENYITVKWDPSIVAYIGETKPTGFEIYPVEGVERVDETNSTVKYFVENNVNNSVEIEVNTIIGDTAFNTNNRIEIYNGSDWVKSTGSWGHRNLPAAGTGLRIQELLAEQIVRGQSKTIKRFQGTFENLPDPTYLLRYGGRVYAPSKFSYKLHNRRWVGEWYEHYYDQDSTFSIQTSGTKVEGIGKTISTGVLSTERYTQVAYPLNKAGADSRTIDMSGYPLPDPDVVSVSQMNHLVQIYRGGVRLWYGSMRDSDSFTIDISTNTIILGRALRLGERLRGTIYEII